MTGLSQLDAAQTLPDGLDGLSSSDAARRLREVGPNRWVARNRWAAVREALAVLLDPMAAMLAIAAVIYFLLGETRDAVVLAVALVPVLGVDVVLEARSRAALAKLARAAAPVAEVVRDAHVRSVAMEQVVPGDLLVVREGHVIAADGVVEWASNLGLDESSLTGESEPQSKRAWLATSTDAPADARVSAGSSVLTGHGFVRVTITGAGTHYGHIARLVEGTAPSPSPLQRRTGRLVRRLGLLAIGVAAALFALNLARGEAWTRALLAAVSLSMAAIPEEFPIVLTLFLSVGAWRLASRGMLVRRLASVETLGSTTVICTDKTGTLTRGRFQLIQHVVLSPVVSDREVLEAALLACERHPVDAMEQAILAYAQAYDLQPDAWLARWTLVRDHDFDPVGKHMSHVWRAPSPDEAFVVAAKGAVEGVLAHSVADPVARERALAANEQLAEHGLRVLAVATKRTASLGAGRDEDERGLVVLGLLGFQDPLRPEVPGAVAECQRAGIRIKMITGDHGLTAHAVAEAAGILHEDGAIVTGTDLEALSESDRRDQIERSAIFARISPSQKFDIVDALKTAGHVVAMTGDGVNDAPALRRADIGIAMGQRGTDVARATADLVLLDDNFASIVGTVREGRHILRNIQRAFLYLIAFHVPIVVLAVLTPLVGVPLVLFPVHLVWLELIVHPVSALVFQAEPASPAVMSEPPRHPTAPLLPRPAIVRSVVSGAVLGCASFATYWSQGPLAGEAVARALALVVLVSGYQVLVFVERLALPHPELAAVPRSLTFWIVWSATALSLVAMLAWPSAAALFRVAPASGVNIVVAALVGAAVVGWRFFCHRGFDSGPRLRACVDRRPSRPRGAPARSRSSPPTALTDRP